MLVVAHVLYVGKQISCMAITDARRKPAIYLMVILPVLVVGDMILVVGLTNLYSQFKNVSLSDLPNLNGMLISLPAIFLWIPCSLLISNLIIRLTPPLRVVAEKYTAQSNGPSFGESQKRLLKVLYIFAMICVPLILLGFVV